VSQPPHRVVQWATGNIGTKSLRGVIEHPDMELVGVYVHSAAKAGRDAGELCGVDPALLERIEKACAAGGTSIHSTGSSPGFITEALPVVVTSIQRRLDSLTIDEFADLSKQMAATTPGYTANRAVNAVPFVCAAAPGIRTTFDLPQILANLGAP
jgi:2,4-diaminopentanoate dehydrogenase